MMPKPLTATTFAAAIALVSTHASFAQTPVPDQIAQRMIERRAVEAVIWGMPAVNYDLMLQEMLSKTDGKVNQVVYWGRPLDWHNQTLTPNPDAIYFMAFFNTKDGPIVLDLPPGDDDGSFNANIVNVWQMPLEDAGLLGADKGKGGKYLILPPGYADKVPDGYIALQSDTFGGYVLFRVQSQEPQRRRRREIDRLRQAHQGLSALAGGQSAADHLHRRQGRHSSTPRSATTRASSSTSIASCRASPGSSATAR